MLGQRRVHLPFTSNTVRASAGNFAWWLCVIVFGLYLWTLSAEILADALSMLVARAMGDALLSKGALAVWAARVASIVIPLGIAAVFIRFTSFPLRPDFWSVPIVGFLAGGFCFLGLLYGLGGRLSDFASAAIQPLAVIGPWTLGTVGGSLLLWLAVRGRATNGVTTRNQP